MSKTSQTSLKQHYQQLRKLSCEELWNGEVARFNEASREERLAWVSVVRAVGVVFSESGTGEQRALAREWVRSLLGDSEEKIRRYAILALPKLESSVSEEGSLLRLLKETASEREKRALITTLERVGGKATLEARNEGDFGVEWQSELRLKANVARVESPSSIRFERSVVLPEGMAIHLHCRKGVQELLREEIQSSGPGASVFRVRSVLPEVVRVVPRGGFSLERLYQFRTFSGVGVVLGEVPSEGSEVPMEALARVIAGADGERVLRALTRGPLRYRLEFGFKTSRGTLVKALAERVFALNPRLLNDPWNAPWEIRVMRSATGYAVELTPKFRPDPRFAYRRGDVPAASHPPLAACLARVAGVREGEVIWDPFCGSGLELVERCRLGGVVRVFGTDLSAEAIETTRENLRSGLLEVPDAVLACTDFRRYRQVPGLGELSLVITNPPLGRRVRIEDISELVTDLFSVSEAVLKPGGCLVLVNPLAIKPKTSGLKLVFRQKVDVGCAFYAVEKYEKVGGGRGGVKRRGADGGSGRERAKR